MRYLTLPTRVGSVTLSANRIATIEPTGEKACTIHMREVTGLGWAEREYSPDGTIKAAKKTERDSAHNVFEVKWDAAALRNVIAHMDDGDHFDPWNLETLEDE